MLNKPNKTANSFAAILVALLAMTPPYSVNAAFLRLGPFDFEAQTRLQGIYTTNVEQERPSEETAEPEDYYFIWALDLNSSAQFLPRTTFTIDTGIAIEEHINRPDLNNTEAPFGRFAADFTTDLEPLTISGNSRFERTAESVEDKFVPTELEKVRKKRQVGTSFDYGGDVQFTGELLELSADYSFTQERYDSYDYYEEEQDEETYGYLGRINIKEYLSLTYQVEFTQTDLVNLPDGLGPLEETETITIDFNFDKAFLERPEVTYSIGVQREYIDGETEGLELVHNVTVSDEIEFSPTFKLGGDITYSYEDNPEEDDITFTYGLSLDHEISKRSRQSLSATREPVDTLGSSTDTDETTYGYGLSIDDFLVQSVTADLGITHTISRPVEGEVERVWNYTTGLSHTAQINSRLSRVVSYVYTRESSNLEFDVLEEHRVTISFELAL